MGEAQPTQPTQPSTWGLFKDKDGNVVVKQGGADTLVVETPVDKPGRVPGNGTAFYDSKEKKWKLAENDSDIPSGAQTERFANGLPKGNVFSGQDRLVDVIVVQAPDNRGFDWPDRRIEGMTMAEAASLISIAIRVNNEEAERLRAEYQTAVGDEILTNEDQLAGLNRKFVEYSAALKSLETAK